MSEPLKQEFEALFHKHHKELIWLSYNMVRDHDAAKDVVQEVFLNLWKNRASVTFGDQIKHYLFKATAHLSINHLKAIHPHFSLDEMNDGVGITDPETDTTSIKELKEKIAHAIDRLPPKCKIIFVLSRQQGLKYREIADILGISPKTVENQMGIALEKLREHLQPYVGKDFLRTLI